jgi:hypothetical protein
MEIVEPEWETPTLGHEIPSHDASRGKQPLFGDDMRVAVHRNPAPAAWDRCEIG